MVILDKVLTAQGSPNIAFIKYWGKRDERLILPCNSSLSITLSRKAFATTTSVVFSDKLRKDRLYINGKEQDMAEEGERLWMLDEMRKSAGTKARVLMVSENNFPTASGIASSASGMATLVYVANAALGLKMKPRELSIMARMGSGSACRSIFGGLVEWHMGKMVDGSDSYAEQLFDEKYWPELVDLLAIVSQKRKKVSSRAGMKQTVETNPLFSARQKSVEERLGKAVSAYRKKDLSQLAEHIMADSNELHALTQSTIPSIRYLNPVSFEIMDTIESLNDNSGKNIAAYTFDAGPNAHIITLKKHLDEVSSALDALKGENGIIETRTSEVGTGPVLLDGASLIDKKRLEPIRVQAKL